MPGHVVALLESISGDEDCSQRDEADGPDARRATLPKARQDITEAAPANLERGSHIEKNPRDQEPAQDEEQLDADVSEIHRPSHIRPVMQDDEAHGDAAYAVQLKHPIHLHLLDPFDRRSEEHASDLPVLPE